MGIHWQYGDITMEIEATLVQHGVGHIAPMHSGESLEHAMFKVSIAAHLLSWGYAWEQIHWEDAPQAADTRDRADLYTDAHGKLPAFWFECIGVEEEKLSSLVASLPGFRVVHVVAEEAFDRLWKGPTEVVIAGDVAQIENITDWRERRKHTLAHRAALLPLGTEYWAVRGIERRPRIVYAVARQQDGSIVFMDTAEGWSLSGFRYIPRKSTLFKALIPGVVGSDQWTGKNSSYYRSK